MIRTGWLVHETNKWTRKGAGVNQSDTNIDIVITRGIESKYIEVEQLTHNPAISDHKVIEIVIKDE